VIEVAGRLNGDMEYLPGGDQRWRKPAKLFIFSQVKCAANRGEPNFSRLPR